MDLTIRFIGVAIIILGVLMVNYPEKFLDFERTLIFRRKREYNSLIVGIEVLRGMLALIFGLIILIVGPDLFQL